MVTQIDWGDGSGDKITLTYSATSGNQTVLVSSNANAGANPRSKVIKFTAVVGNTIIERTLTVTQLAGSDDLIVPTYNDIYPVYDDVARGFRDTSV